MRIKLRKSGAERCVVCPERESGQRTLKIIGAVGVFIAALGVLASALQLIDAIKDSRRTDDEE